jgi:Ser/Thr protein kinase RdoA (MazF antagonist)
LAELADQDIPVAPALSIINGSTLGEIEGMYYSLFPRVSGRLPDELDEQRLTSLGRLLARLHNVGALKTFEHRPILHDKPHSLWENLELLEKHVSVELWPRYESAAIQIVDQFEELIENVAFQRIHGDFHRGNTLVLDGSFKLVDFDDSCEGPVVQDLWMLFSSADWRLEADYLLRGYEEFRSFPGEQLKMIPALRGARILSYAAWIARRWSDPSFPRLFPDFGSHRYWSVETEALERIVFSDLQTSFH